MWSLHFGGGSVEDKINKLYNMAQHGKSFREEENKDYTYVLGAWGMAVVLNGVGRAYLRNRVYTK